jgi:hypothetical protein
MNLCRRGVKSALPTTLSHSEPMSVHSPHTGRIAQHSLFLIEPQKHYSEAHTEAETWLIFLLMIVETPHCVVCMIGCKYGVAF